MKRSTRLALYGAVILLQACSSLPGPAATSAACPVVEGKPSPADAAGLRALQRKLESSPLYMIPAADEGLAACSIRLQVEEVTVLEYRFRQGGWLKVTADPRIEYLEQNASFILPDGDTAEAILAGAERAAFGAAGCAIDWQQAETRTAGGARETVYRGDVCNCQAIIRRDGGGKLLGLLLRSAC